VDTTGSPAALVLEPDRNLLVADGADVCLVTVRVVDNQGRTVPVASNTVDFTVTGAGRLLGVGNGDPSSHESDKATQRAVFNGRCLALLQASHSAGVITLKAEAAGLKWAVATVRAR